MELFLNLCWLALLLPAYALWRRKVAFDCRARTSLAVIGTLGCALILLFPVISASDDLCAVGQAMEESEHTLRHDNTRACACHSLAHVLPLISFSSSSEVVFAPVRRVFPPPSRMLETVLADASAGRAPPQRPIV